MIKFTTRLIICLTVLGLCALYAFFQFIKPLNNVVYWTNAVKEEPSVKNFLTLIDALSEEGRFKEAEVCALRGRGRYPNSEALRLSYANILLLQGRKAEAKVYLSELFNSKHPHIKDQAQQKLRLL